jgi:hypothetical protein
MSQAALAAATRSGASRNFYVWMAGACLVIALLGFMPTYFFPMAHGTFKAEPVVHIHGMILYSWVLLFFAQTWLVARGKVLAHRSWGMLGIAIVTGIVFIVTTLVSLRISQASQPGQPPGLAHAVRAFEWVSFSGIIFVVPIFVLGIVKVRQAETHKRLMLLFTISLLGAPIARWFITFLAPPPGPDQTSLGLPPPSVTIAPGLVGDLMILVAMVYDWRTRGRPHWVYLVGLPYLLVLQTTVTPIAESPAWQAVAAAIGHLAG